MTQAVEKEVDKQGSHALGNHWECDLKHRAQDKSWDYQVIMKKEMIINKY